MTRRWAGPGLAWWMACCVAVLVHGEDRDFDGDDEVDDDEMSAALVDGRKC